VLADDDPKLSPLWIGRRAPFHAFQTALGCLAGAYDLRDTRSNDPMTRVSICVDDWHGQPITTARRFPVAAFDDLLFAVQQIRDRRIEENQRHGWTAQANADRRSAVRDHWKARGTDMNHFRAQLRDMYAEAARLTDQPHPND
jgi:hypothetical protein